MIIILYSLFIIIFFIVAIFVFPQFSPIPYFPTNKKDLGLIIKALNLKNNQVIVDLGAGDGIVILEVAKEALRRKLNTKFIAVEINPVLLCILYVRRLIHPNRENITIMYGNMFTMNLPFFPTSYSLPPTFYLYISPWYLEKTVSNIKRQLQRFNVISYMYSIKTLKSKEKIIEGKNKMYVYQVF